MNSKQGNLARMRAVLITLGVAIFCGCSDSPYQFAAVSGVVTLDGAPLANAAVRFHPQQTGSPMVGPSSHAVTDDEGRYVLKTHEGRRGAVVGPHVVSVSTLDQRLVDPKNSDRVEIISKERVPRRYRSPSDLRFEVPGGGAEEANFALLSK